MKRHGSIHFYVYCPTHESLTTLHRKKKNGNLAKRFKQVLEEKTKKESVGLELDMVDDRPVHSMYCYSLLKVKIHRMGQGPNFFVFVFLSIPMAPTSDK